MRREAPPGRRPLLPRIIRAALHPVTGVWTTPVRLAQSLWAARVLGDGRWSRYPHFNAKSGINSLFYWTRARNLDRFGRSGLSPFIGLGDYALSRCFHYSLGSLYAYWRAGAVTVLVGTLAWVAAHGIWLSALDWWWVALVLAVTMAGTTFYVNLFALQNYNALGWAAFPIGVHGLLQGELGLTAVAWLGVSFGSFSVTVFAGIVSAAAAIHAGSPLPFLTMVPAAIKIATHFRAVVVSGRARRTLGGVAKAIGAVRRTAKYRRTRTEWTWVALALLGLWGQFGVAHWVLSGGPSFLIATGLLVVVVNTRLARFADSQSLMMLLLSLGAAETLAAGDPRLLVFYWLAASPPPAFVGVSALLVDGRLPVCKPFDVGGLLADLDRFLAPVEPGARVLMAYDNPDGAYERVFDGYRVIWEAPLYVASSRGFFLFPDWWAIFELNDPDAAEPWGRSVPDVSANVQRWTANFVIVYQTSDGPLDPEWHAAGFESLTHFDWAAAAPALEPHPPWRGPAPRWWLLRPPPSQPADMAAT